MLNMTKAKNEKGYDQEALAAPSRKNREQEEEQTETSFNRTDAEDPKKAQEES